MNNKYHVKQPCSPDRSLKLTKLLCNERCLRVLFGPLRIHQEKKKKNIMEFKRHFNKHYFLSNFVNQAQAHHFFSLIAWNIFFCACFATFFRENWVKSVLMELPWMNTVNFLGFHVSGNIILPHAVLLLASLLVCSLVHSRWLCYIFFCSLVGLFFPPLLSLILCNEYQHGHAWYMIANIQIEYELMKLHNNNKRNCIN